MPRTKGAKDLLPRRMEERTRAVLQERTLGVLSRRVGEAELERIVEHLVKLATGSVAGQRHSDATNAARLVLEYVAGKPGQAAEPRVAQQLVIVRRSDSEIEGIERAAERVLDGRFSDE